MKHIYLVDYLGVHCGMHYYLDAFRSVLKDLPGIKVNILSNYSPDSSKIPFFLNQYKGSIINKCLSLVVNLHRLRRFISKNKEDIFVYLTYGNAIDIPFMQIITNIPYHIIDIHEAIAQNKDNDSSLKKRFKALYLKKVHNVISHSYRTDEFLQEYEFHRKVFHVPHFKYIFPKEYNTASLTSVIVGSIEKNKINLLFFGNINENKGIDILLNALNQLSPTVAEKINLIIAGKDFDGLIDKIKIKDTLSVKLFKRHITDDELRYLYQNVDYICLPYRKTSQSGILEMAFYFKKPIITTDVPYFRKILTEFPSFGILSGCSVEEYSNTLEYITQNNNHQKYFIDQEYARYENRDEVCEFKKDLYKWIKNSE